LCLSGLLLRKPEFPGGQDLDYVGRLDTKTIQAFQANYSLWVRFPRANHYHKLVSSALVNDVRNTALPSSVCLFSEPLTTAPSMTYRAYTFDTILVNIITAYT